MKNCIEYENLALVIKPMLKSDLIKTYTTYIDPEVSAFENNHVIIKLLCKEILDIETKELTLEKIIAHATKEALETDNTIADSIRRLREARRFNKRNWFASIKEEIEMPNQLRPRNPQLLYQAASSAYNLSRYDRDSSGIKTIEDRMQELYQKIDNWKSDVTALITDFYFFASKPAKSQINAFIHDVALESLNIINRHFNGNPNGYLTKFPLMLTKTPIFNYRSTTIDFELEILQNEIHLFNHFEFDGGNIQVELQPESLNLPNKLPPSSTSLSVEEIKDKYNIQTLTTKDLDMKDRELINTLYNMMTAEIVKTRRITGELKALARIVLMIDSPRKKHLEDIKERLFKIQNYHYSVKITDKKTGKETEQLSLNMISMANVYSQNGVDYYEVTPSDQMITTYIQKEYVNILSQSYNVIISSQTRAFLILLQAERLRTYIGNNSLEENLSFKFFRIHMKLQQMRPSTLKKELLRHLQILKEKKVVVEDFIINQSSIQIKFTPLDNLEQSAYNITPIALTDTQGIIDAECIETS